MTVSKKLIENVGELRKALNEISVYDLDVYTSMELYYKIANKLNEVIKELMRFEGVVSDEVIKQNEKLMYLLGEGLNIEVVKKINQMIEDGTMDSIINHNVFNSLNNKIEDYKEELSSQIEDYKEELSSQIEDYKEELSSQIKDVDNKDRYLANSKGYLNIPVYNSDSMQATHPSVLFFPNKFKGYNYWMAMTPYEQENEALENPSILASNDGVYWVVPDGLTNPLISTDNVTDYHFSDVHLVYVKDKLECWFRKVTRGSLPVNEIIMRKTSKDGVTWSSEEILYQTNQSSRNDFALCPVVIYEDNIYKIWVMNRHTKKLDYFESTSGTNWQKIRSITVPHKDNLPIWHFDIKHTRNGYELYACVGNTYRGKEICYSISKDNVNYSEFKTVMTNSELGFDETALYRPCFVDTWGTRRFIYYGGINNSNAWRIGLSVSSSTKPTYLKGVNLENNENVYNVNEYIIEKNLRLRPNSKILMGSGIITEEKVKLIKKGKSAVELVVSDTPNTLEVRKDNSTDVGNMNVGVIHKLRSIVNDVLSILPSTSGNNSNLKLMTPSKWAVNLFCEKTDTLTIRKDDNTKYGYIEANKLTFKNDLNNINHELYVDKNRLLFFDGNYVQKVQLGISGNTTERPSSPYIGQFYFDRVINKPIWCKSISPVIWITADGTEV